MNTYFVYILSSSRGTLYTGVTNDLYSRILTHKNKGLPGFTSKYDVKRLIYFEIFRDIDRAILREKEIKGWRRKKKLALIRTLNPKFEDLARDW